MTASDLHCLMQMAEQSVLSSIDNKAGHGLMNVRDATQKGLCLLQRLALQNSQRLCRQPQVQHPLMTSNQNQVGSVLQAGHMFECMALPLLYIPSVC